MSRRSNAFGVGILSLPTWADYTALPNGRFIEFTLNLPQDVGMQYATFGNWCGGAFVPDFGARGGAVYAGGGEHNQWTDSSTTGPGQQGAYVLDCDTRLYSRKCYPVTNHTGATLSGAPTPVDIWGAYVDDGSPQSKHTYTCTSYMPAAWGGGSSGSFVLVSQSGGLTGTQAAGYSGTWKFDLSSASHSAGAPSVTKLTGANTYNYGDGLPAGINNAPTACIDMTREGWWSTHRVSSGQGGKMAFTSKAGVITSPQGQTHGFDNYCAMHHFATDDVVVSLTDIVVNGEWVWQPWVWQAGTANAWAQNTNITRQTITDEYAPGFKAYPAIGEMQPRWSSILGCFVGIDYLYPWGAQPTTTVRVWKITPPASGQRFSGTWTATWELVQAKAGTEATNRMNMTQGVGDAAAFNSAWGKLVECPSLRAFVWSRDVNKPGQLIRLQGM